MCRQQGSDLIFNGVTFLSCNISKIGEIKINLFVGNNFSLTLDELNAPYYEKKKHEHFLFF